MNSPTNPADQTTRTTTDSTTTAPGGGEVWTIERIRALGVTTTLATASVLGISRSQAYRLAATDQFPLPLIRAGSRIIVPVARLLQLLLVEDPAPTDDHRRLDADAKVSVDAMTPPPADSTRHRWLHHTKHPGDDE
ncbi:hypothetical protein [Micromonospora musae]|uniref:Uncharacterized protein n=1 Tax=Micromonospora musae TaxID=1894970 RepID=A0A3A9XLW4_9ACTN|nr:hypothetical protein [Micromonospora musae]RKN26189.1 hypothetical protein D7044_30635 [Micromonospora musae]